jgi:hypothetical protein
MPVFLPAWLTSAADAIRRLADRPWTLFFLLLAFNAIARPCSSAAHDGRLYSLQALNQAGGGYADDVFLRFGSQDQFSLFSRVVGPIVALVGVRPAFFALYLVFNALFIFGLFRLVRALIDDALIATLSLLFLVSAPLPYGGGDIFTVHEQFFTPRVIATALTLFALERTLRQRFGQALLFLIAGTLIHPLMAFGGVLIWVGCVAWTLPIWLSATSFAAIAAAGLVVLLNRSIGVRIFGEMDDDWHELIRLAVGYNYPDTWAPKVWLNVALSFAIPGAACFTVFRGDVQRRRFLIAATLAGAAGLLGTVVATELPYALLFQGQPYRVMWILKVLQVPLGFTLIAHGCQATSLFARLGALVLVAYFCVTHYIGQELSIFVIAVPISMLIGLLTDPDRRWWYPAARGFVLGALGWMAFRWVFFVNQRTLIAEHFDLGDWILFDLVSPVFLLVALWVLARWQPSLNLGWGSAAVALAIPLLLFATEISPTFQRNHTRLGGDIAFVRDFVHDLPSPSGRGAGDEGRRPAIYCSSGRADLLWINVNATSYFSIIQTAGVMFNRQTALEIDRRCGIVGKFEMAHERSEMLFPDEGRKTAMQNLFKIDFNCPPPTRDDLVRLCHEPGLDYVVIPQEFPGLYSASNGRFFIYECYKIRAASGVAHQETSP